jgi:hypothetical protein
MRRRIGNTAFVDVVGRMFYFGKSCFSRYNRASLVQYGQATFSHMYWG